MLGVSSLSKKLLKNLAALSRLFQASRARIELCKTLVQLRIARSFRSSRFQRSSSLPRHVVRFEKVSFSDRSLNRFTNVWRIVKLHGRNFQLQLIHHECLGTLFGGELPLSRVLPQLSLNLFVILPMQRVLWLQLR